MNKPTAALPTARFMTFSNDFWRKPAFPPWRWPATAAGRWFSIVTDLDGFASFLECGAGTVRSMVVAAFRGMPRIDARRPGKQESGNELSHSKIAGLSALCLLAAGTRGRLDGAVLAVTPSILQPSARSQTHEPQCQSSPIPEDHGRRSRPATGSPAASGMPPHARPTRSSTSASSASHGRGGDNMDSRRAARTSSPCATSTRTTWPRPPSSIPKAKTYADWRKLLDQKDLDAVVVSTADQAHALASNWAMKRGLSVYCEKPLAHSVHEARMVRRNVPGQQGQAGHADGHADPRRRQLPPRGRAGPVGRDRAGRARSTSGAAASAPAAACPRASSPCPSNLHWDLWLGPAPLRPYQPGLPAGQSHLEPLVGLRQRHARRHGQPRDRPALLGLEAPRPADGRGPRRSAARLARHQRPLADRHLGAPGASATGRP